MTFTPEELAQTAFSPSAKILNACVRIRTVLYKLEPTPEELELSKAALQVLSCAPVDAVFRAWDFLNDEENVDFCLMNHAGTYKAFESRRDLLAYLKGGKA